MTVARTGARARVLRTATVVALLCSLAAGCSSKESMFDDGKVHVGAKGDQPGTSFEPHDGEFNGFDVTVARELLTAVDVDSPYFSGVLSKNRAANLQNGDLDLVAATFSITPQRMKPQDEGGEGLDFVGPYASTQQGILVREEDYGQYKDHDDLDGRLVCVWEGTTSAQELKGPAYDKIRTVEEDDAGYCIKALREKRVDAVSTDQLILYGFMNVERGLRVVPGIRFGEPNDYGIAMLKGHREDCERLRDALRTYVNGNDWDRDFENNLPKVPKADRDEARPTPEEIDALSCRDKPSNAAVG
ncbi:transporter substrate-binding domain-containing protein [Streptomyces bluensis]|uniref:transporter substrate-binding domain-containing protein n=1 Tax=Streptomyces bluensis TaxID=33897 RepID=UPI001678B05A|nr:transporter substrate-binding domain-containing protein [Streptomyces bluensis]